MRLICLALVLLPACHDADPQFVDAGPGIDAATDAGDDASGDDGGGGDAPGTDVTVHVRNRLGDGGPDLAATVYLSSADGTLRETAMPDASGVVRFDAIAGDSVTVRAGGPVVDYTTVLGVEPGDDLRFGLDALARLGQMEVTLPEATNTLRYTTLGPCVAPESENDNVMTIGWWGGCPDDRTLILIAERAIGTGAVVSMMTVPVTVADGVSLELTGTWVDAVAVALPIAGVTPGSRVTGAYMLGDEYVPGMVATLTDAPPTLRWRRPANLDNGALVEVISPDGLSTTLQRLPPTVTSIDVTPRLPTVTSLVAAPEVTWSVSAPDPIDAFVIQTAVGNARWTFVAPPDARTLVRPQLPAAPATTLMDLTVVDRAGAGYAAFRPDAGNPQRLLPGPPPVGYDLQARKAMP